MSVRIHQLSKKIGMENKELIELLRERGFEVKSASSTIDNISAESIEQEFLSTEAAEETESVEEKVPEEVKPPVTLPAGAIVKSAADLERERKEKAEAEKAAKEAEAAAKAEASKDAATPEDAKPAAKAPPAPKGPPAPPAAKGPPVPPRGSPPAPARQTPPLPPKSAPKAASGGAPTIRTDAPQAAPEAKEPVSEPVSEVKAKAPVPPTPPVGGPPKPPGPPSAGKPPAPARPAAESAPAPEGTEDAETSAPIHIKPPIVVRDFATAIGLKPFKLISELMEMGIFASMNQTIEEATALKVAATHGVTLEIHHRGEQQTAADPSKPKSEAQIAEEESKLLEPRPPVVCILGHVDHGKTTLTDRLRRTNMVEGEAGGITQHIGAYQIEHNDKKISILDTPGHAAFSRMRQRGADITDVAILVVAADDGFMPQTDEALKFARRDQVGIIVAINKCDVKGANVDRVKQQMQERGIAPEDWGGETIAVPISALKGEGIEELLEMIHLQAEVMELRAIPSGQAKGRIIESQMEQGRGSTATVIVERGTLKNGDALVCGEVYCRVKTMVDDRGKILKSAGPATPVKVAGWSSTPGSGAKFEVVKNEREAKRMAEAAAEERKRSEFSDTQDASKAATVEDLFEAIATTKKKSLRVIIKADVHGSAEALADSLKLIESTKVDLKVLSTGVGMITKNDVSLASASEAALVGFNVKLDNGVLGLAKHHGVRIIQHNIIYELIATVEEAMTDLLDAELHERKTGAAEVRQIFNIGKNRYVAGCMITEGKIIRDRRARVVRKGETIGEGRISTLRRFKEDVNEVRAGYECGINVEGMKDYQEGDQIQCIEIEEIRPSL